MSKLNSMNVQSFHPILPEVFASEAIEFDLTKFKPRSQSKYFKTNVFETYKIFHNLLYYFCIVPFKIQHDPSEVEVQFKGSKFKQGVCIVLHVMHFFHAFPPILASINEIQIHVGADPSKFYHMLWEISGFIMIMAFSVICIKQFRLKAFLTHLRKFQTEIVQVKQRIMIYTIISISVTIITAYLFAHKITKLDFGSLNGFIESGIIDVGSHFHIDITTGTQNVTEHPLLHLEMVGKLVLISFHHLLITMNYIMAIMLEVLVLLTCLSVCQIGYDFWDAIKPHQRDSLNLLQLTQCYDETKSMINELNRTLGVQILSFMLAAIPYYGIHIIQLFDGDWFQKLETIYFMLLYSGALLLAAEGHRKFQQFPEFIFHNHKQLGQINNHEELSIFLQQVTTSQIGLKGFGFFTISYGFLGNVLGLVLTHVIIMLQFKTTVKC